MTPTCGECNDELLTEDEEACGFCRACEAAQWERGELVEAPVTAPFSGDIITLADVFIYDADGSFFLVDPPPEPQ